MSDLVIVTMIISISVVTCCFKICATLESIAKTNAVMLASRIHLMGDKDDQYM